MPPTHTLTGRHAVVIGGGITGLAATRVLAERGAAVTILERDAEPDTATPDEAFTSWTRKGAPQVRHSHAFLGRLRSLLRDRYPDLLEALRAAGAAELDMLERPPLTLPPLERQPGDEDLVALGCRRTTFEWVLRRDVLSRAGVGLVSGAHVAGLLATDGRPPSVTGVRYAIDAAANEIAADMVIDASGRHSKAPEWLQAIGAAPPRERQSRPASSTIRASIVSATAPARRRRVIIPPPPTTIGSSTPSSRPMTAPFRSPLPFRWRCRA